jgi:hypothetical protein
MSFRAWLQLVPGGERNVAIGAGAGATRLFGGPLDNQPLSEPSQEFRNSGEP